MRALFKLDPAWADQIGQKFSLFKSLYIDNLNNKRPNSEIKFLKNKIGRIRDVLVHPKGHILLINDERDGGLFKLDKY